ncbi:unnamed protein product [Linum trigynum]|uniref:Uncharacterized protein n=1 Tax=Linum trigynum TaxID=586398 RepID=A0AAV2G3K3_9ROSI
MGTCCSKKTVSSSVNNAATSSSSSPCPGEPMAKAGEQKQSVKVVKNEVSPAADDDSSKKKEIFVIKHRNSHDSGNNNKPRSSSSPEISGSDNGAVSIENGKVDGVSGLSAAAAAVRTSSCSKEEVEAILIQCGRLSRNNSFGTAGKSSPAKRKYSGSKRSFDFDEQNDRDLGQEEDGGDERRDSRRQHRHRQSSRNSSPASQARRRTPSREREQRSGSRERGPGGSGSGRRVSRSPGRRSESNTAASAAANAGNSIANNNNNNNNNNGNGNKPPGKMVSVPPTVSSAPSSNKSNSNNNNNGVEAAQAANSSGIKRISVKRNAGGEAPAAAGSRSVASPRSKSPRSRSPGRTKSDCNQQQPSLSRNSSRKAEQSPHRRNPLAEIDPSSLAYPQASGAKASSNWAHNDGREPIQKQNPLPAAESLKQPLTRSRSSRRSRDLDINTEALLNPQQTSYTSLLLEDIHNFHNKSSNTNIISNNSNNIPPSMSSSFQLPACVTKACSILDAVADLNSTTSSNLSSTLSEDHHRKQQQQLSKAKDPFLVESEVVTIDDLMEPSFHKYVTVRRGSGLSCGREEEMEMQEESSGSNSIVAGGGGGWGNSSYNSGWEPSSADSTDRWSSRDNNNTVKEREVEEEKNAVAAPLGLGIGQRVHGLGEKRSSSGGGREMMGGIEEAARMAFSGQRNGGIGRGRLAASGNRSHHLLATTSNVAAAAST